MGSLGGSEVAKKKAMWLYPKVMGFNPSERWGHSACYFHGVVYVYGGCCGGLHFDDVLALNLQTMAWTTLTTSGQGPGPRDSHSAVLVEKKMIIFGGTNGLKKVNDLHVLDLDSKVWTQPECTGPLPSPRESHTATLIGDDKLVIFGGSGEGEGNYLNDLYVLDLATMRWICPDVKGEIPVPRDSHSAVLIRNKLVVYGGDCGDRYYGGADMLDMESLTWSKVVVKGSSPGIRAGHAAVNIGTKVFVIGGVGDKRYYNDVWMLDIFTSSWIQLEIRGQQPQGRFSHTAIVNESDIAIYGGCGEDERPLGELLILQLGSEHPNGRYNISMCKMFGSHWNQGRRRPQRDVENNSNAMLFGNKVGELRKEVQVPDSEPKQPFRFSSDTLHPKRRRTSNSRIWEIESEQEEHSLSLSQHSSPSLSDQEQTQAGRRSASDPVRVSHGYPLFRHHPIPINFPDNGSANQTNRRKAAEDVQFLKQQQIQPTEEQVLHLQQHKPLEAGAIQNLIGAEVRGKVDGAFDSGYLMTAVVNGKIFRGVLFSPAPCIALRGNGVSQNSSHAVSPIGLARPVPNMNHLESNLALKPCKRPMMADSVHNFPASQVSRPSNRTASPSLSRETKLRSDLQGVVLTLGGPGSSH